MKLRFSPRAVQDLVGIADYIKQYNPRAARRVRAAVLESLRIVALFPHSGRSQRLLGVRKHVTRPYPYIVYYVVDVLAEEIHVIAIQHSAQKREHDDE